MREKVAPLGHADSVECVGTACDDAHCVRICKPRVFTGRYEHSPEDKGSVFSGGDHAREPIHRGVWVAPPQAFNKRADDIVVIIAVAVVEHDFFLNRFFGGFAAYVDRRTPRGHGRRGGGIPFFGCRFYCEFERVQQTARVSVRRFDQVFESAFFEFDFPMTVAALFVAERLFCRFSQIVVCQRFQLKYAAPAHERFIDFEKRIFGRRSD